MMVIIKKMDRNERWRACTRIGPSDWLECKMEPRLWKTVWQFLKGLDTELSCDPATPLLVYTQGIEVKAGGMRIVQKHPHSGDTKEEKDKDDQEWESPSPPKPTVFISGVIARGDKDFPPAAAQVAHQKPHASMDKHTSPRTQHIQQPRK
uniref:Death associated protein n=1 Tax=Equus caballus TaxID=9796 RepID=A0A3Q2H9A8_HORSE